MHIVLPALAVFILVVTFWVLVRVVHAKSPAACRLLAVLACGAVLVNLAHGSAMLKPTYTYRHGGPPSQPEPEPDPDPKLNPELQLLPA